MDNRQFSYITNMGKKNPQGMVGVRSRPVMTGQYFPGFQVPFAAQKGRKEKLNPVSSLTHARITALTYSHHVHISTEHRHACQKIDR